MERHGRSLPQAPPQLSNHQCQRDIEAKSFEDYCRRWIAVTHIVFKEGVLFPFGFVIS